MGSRIKMLEIDHSLLSEEALENLIIDIYGFDDNQINVVIVMNNLKFVLSF